MKLFGYGLMVGSLIMGALIDAYRYPDVEFGVFTSFALFLFAIYVLIVEDKRKF